MSFFADVVLLGGVFHGTICKLMLFTSNTSTLLYVLRVFSIKQVKIRKMALWFKFECFGSLPFVGRNSVPWPHTTEQHPAVYLGDRQQQWREQLITFCHSHTSGHQMALSLLPDGEDIHAKIHAIIAD